jgi:tetratricopeptide (TPR) repeat protein
MVMNGNNLDQIDFINLMNQGINEATTGNVEKARYAFQKVLRYEPHNETALLWMAWIANDALEAVALLEKIIARNPRNEIAHAYLKQAKVRCLGSGSLRQAGAGASSETTLRPAVQPPRPVENQKVIPLLGEFLMREGFITLHQLKRAMQIQKTNHYGQPKPIGQILIELGYLTATQLETGIKMQREQYFYNAS